MNKRALFFGLAYSATIIAYKLILLYGNYSFTKFGFYYANVVGILAIVPFFILCVQQVRDKEYGGFIGGREAIRLAFTVLSVSIIVISAYNYFEVGSEKFRTEAEKYYRGSEYLELLTTQQKLIPEKLKVEDIVNVAKKYLVKIIKSV